MDERGGGEESIGAVVGIDDIFKLMEILLGL